MRRLISGPVILCGLALALAWLYAVVVRPGSAGDEPAHFETVQFYANRWRMPVLGQPGVAYEGQMGPVYYTLAGVAYSVVRPLGDEAAFYAIRLLTALTIVPIVWLTHSMARRVAADESYVPLLAGLAVAVNPSLLALSGSVQNDSLTIVFCLTATHGMLCLMEQRDDPSAAVAARPWRWAFIALIVSLAILTKATAVYLAVGTSAYLAWRFRRDALVNLTAFAIVIGLCCGWWFIRNQVLYGDFSAQRALTLYHYNNNPPPVSLRRLSSWGTLAYGLLSQWLVPTEYYRNVFRTPTFIRGLAATLYATLGVVVARFFVAGDVFERKRETAFLTVQVATCLAIWVLMCGTKTLFASRCTYPTFPLIVIGTCVCIAQIGVASGTKMRVAVASLLMGSAVLNCYVLHSLVTGPTFPFHMFV